MEKELDFGTIKITIKKMPLKRILSLIELIKDVPPDIRENLMNIDKTTDDEFIANLPIMITSVMPQVAKVVAHACNHATVTPELLTDELGLDENLQIVETLLEVNNIKGIIERIKKIGALYQGINIRKPMGQSTAAPVTG